jgi:DNA polymerase-3 subunit gamma/tau
LSKLSSLTKEQPVSQPNSENASVGSPEKNKPFTELDFKEKFAEYCNILQRDEKAGLHATLTTAPAKLNGSTYTLSLANSVQEKQVISIKQELVEFLRNELENNEITIDTVVTKAAAATGVYTNEDKYKVLVNENPALDELRKRLNLDFE